MVQLFIICHWSEFYFTENPALQTLSWFGFQLRVSTFDLAWAKKKLFVSFSSMFSFHRVFFLLFHNIMFISFSSTFYCVWNTDRDFFLFHNFFSMYDLEHETNNLDVFVFVHRIAEYLKRLSFNILIILNHECLTIQIFRSMQYKKNLSQHVSHS